MRKIPVCVSAALLTIPTLSGLWAQTSYTAALVGPVSTVHPRAMNGHGDVAGYIDVTVGGLGATHAFVWKAGTLTDLGTLGGRNSRATGINNDGVVIGWSETSSTATPIAGSLNAYNISHAFSYSSGTMTDLGSAAGANGSSTALLINNSGLIVGQTDTMVPCGEDYFHNPIYCYTAFFYSNGQMTTYGTPTSFPLTPAALNDSGQAAFWNGITRGYCSSLTPHEHAYLYSAGTLTDIGDLGAGCFTDAVGINASGTIAGMSRGTDNVTQAAIYSGGVLRGIGGLQSGYASTATAISSNGWVIGRASTQYNTGYGRGFLYNGSTLTDLGSFDSSWNASLSACNNPQAINSSGVVVGYVCHGVQTPAYVYANGTLTILNDPNHSPVGVVAPALGETLQSADFLNDAGQILAGGTNYYLLTPVAATPSATVTTAHGATASYSTSVQTVTLTANVTSGSGTVNSGSVTFGVPGTSISGNVAGGVAQAVLTIPAGTTAGPYAIAASYTPGSGFGSSSDNTQQLVIQKATPVITWSNPADILYGSALGPTQLNATASVAGSFSYNPPAGTVLSVGDGQALSATFTPSSSANYTTANKNVAINVKPASSGGSPAQLVITKTMSRDSGQIVVVLNVANAGGTAAANVQLTTAKLNTTAGTPLPQSLGAIAAGSSVSTTVRFPGSVGASGVAAVLTVAGSHNAGTFNSATRVTLP